MKSLSSAMGSTLREQASSDELAAKAARAAQVKRMWQAVVENCAHNAAPLILDKTNSVYIIKQPQQGEVSRETLDKTPAEMRLKSKMRNRASGTKELIVYVEDSIVAAELDARREMLKLKFLELFGEDLDAFRIKISRGRYKLNHPYRESHKVVNTIAEQPRKPLSASKLAELDKELASIPNKRVREALKKAMISDLEVKNAKNTIEQQNGPL